MYNNNKIIIIIVIIVGRERTRIRIRMGLKGLIIGFRGTNGSNGTKYGFRGTGFSGTLVLMGLSTRVCQDLLIKC